MSPYASSLNSSANWYATRSSSWRTPMPSTTQLPRHYLVRESSEVRSWLQFLRFRESMASQILQAARAGLLSSPRTSQFTPDFSAHLGLLSSRRTSQLFKLDFLFLDGLVPPFLYFFLFVWKIRSPACRIPARDQAEAKRETTDERRSETVFVFRVFHDLGAACDIVDGCFLEEAMGSSALHDATQGIIEWGKNGAKTAQPRPKATEIFGSLTFNDDVQRRRLPRDVYKALRRTITQGAAARSVDRPTSSPPR